MDHKNPTFEQSINVTMHWCSSWEDGYLSDEVLSDRVEELISSKIGARGFFAYTLSSDCTLMDRLPDSLIFKFIELGDLIVELTVKNFAMSSAMEIEHKLNGNKDLEGSSKRISLRCIELLKVLDSSKVKYYLDMLIEAFEGKGMLSVFIKNQNYIDIHKKTIINNIYLIANK